MQAPPALPSLPIEASAPSPLPANGAIPGFKAPTGDPFAEIFLRLILGPGLPGGLVAPSSSEGVGDSPALADTNGRLFDIPVVENPSLLPDPSVLPEINPQLADSAILSQAITSQLQNLPGLPIELLAELTPQATAPLPGRAPLKTDAPALNYLLSQEIAPLASLFPTTTPITKPADQLTASGKDATRSIESLAFVDTPLLKPSVPSTDLIASVLASPSFEPVEIRSRLIESFQPSPLLNPRYASGPLSPSSLIDNLSEGSLEPGLGEFLPAGVVDRVVVDQAALKEIDRLFGKAESSDFLERGASVLTPDELRTTTSTPQDRNAAALARVDQQAFVDRIMQALERAHAEAPKRIEIDLNPPSLGQVKLHVTEQNGQLIAKLEVTTSSTRNLLLDHLPTLDRQLSEQGVQIQRFQVDQMNTADSAVEHIPDREVKSHSAGDESAQGRNESRHSDSHDSPKRDHWTGNQTNQEALHRSARKVKGETEGRTALPIGVLLGLADGMDQLI